MILRGTTVRLLVLHFVLAALSAALVLGFVFWKTTRVIDAEIREVVAADIAGLAESYQTGGVLGLSEAINRRLDSGGRPDAVYLLTDAYGAAMAGNLASWPPNAVPGNEWVQLDLFRTGSTHAAPVAARTFRLNGGEQLLVGRDAQARVTFDRNLFQALLGALALAALFGAGSAWFTSRFVTSRLGQISDTAHDIIAGGLNARVTLSGNGDEFDRVGATLNQMLDRIEDLIGEMRMVTDSVAHDLRSPLTRLVGHLEQADREGLPVAERQRLIAKAQSEAHGVLNTFSELLAIARTEAGMGREQFAPVDLGTLMDDLAELYAPVAEDRQISLRREGSGTTILGHAPLLAQAVSNLLENALHHAPSGSEIVLEAGPGGSVSVCDNGAGIAPEDRTRALQRFVRLDPSRSGPGTGLGLSLASAVARMHGGNLVLGDNAPGLRAEIALGAAPVQAAT